jgi:hypothetical protein
VHLGQHGQIIHMPKTPPTLYQNVPMLEFVIVTAEYVHAMTDSLDWHAKEVYWLYANLICENFMNVMFSVDKCPNDCSGRGICTSIQDISILTGAPYDISTQYSGYGKGINYVHWDMNSIFACFCENGYFGSDCSLGTVS